MLMKFKLVYIIFLQNFYEFIVTKKAFDIFIIVCLISILFGHFYDKMREKESQYFNPAKHEISLYRFLFEKITDIIKILS